MLTRPLGASVADRLGKAPSNGGLGWGDGTVFGLGLALFAALVAYLTLTHGDVEGTHLSHQQERSAAGLPEPDAEPDYATD